MKIKSFASRDELIWAAGLFEGEGWISIQKLNPIIGLQTCDKDVLDRFVKAVGGGAIHHRKPRIYHYEKIKSRKEQWAWRVGRFEYVQAILAMFWPWLGSRRRARIKEVLALGQLANPKRGMRVGTKIRTRECGDVRKYWQGCKCEACLQANRQYAKELRERDKKELPQINRVYIKQVRQTV